MQLAFFSPRTLFFQCLFKRILSRAVLKFSNIEPVRDGYHETKYQQRLTLNLVNLVQFKKAIYGMGNRALLYQ